jgi:drug/metabolite transporter (DMT)-like permease
MGREAIQLQRHHGTPVSDGLAIAAGPSWAASSIVVKKVRRNTGVDLLSPTTWQTLLGAVVLIVIAVLVPAPPKVFSGYRVFAIAWTAIVGTGLAWRLWMYVLGERPHAASFSA